MIDTSLISIEHEKAELWTNWKRFCLCLFGCLYRKIYMCACVCINEHGRRSCSVKELISSAGGSKWFSLYWLLTAVCVCWWCIGSVKACFRYEKDSASRTSFFHRGAQEFLLLVCILFTGLEPEAVWCALNPNGGWVISTEIFALSLILLDDSWWFVVDVFTVHTMED